MVIRKGNGNDIRPSEITPREIYREPPRAHGEGGSFGAGAALAGSAALPLASLPFAAQAATLAFEKSKFSTSEPVTAREYVTSYNNYYEFGVDKGDPGQNAHTLTTTPWNVKVDGLVAKPADYALEDFVKPFALEQRVYRHRCVEGWSMVIPWVGFPLAKVLERAEPLGSAKFVAFETLMRPSEMPGQHGLFQPLEWPYVEGLAPRRGHASADGSRGRHL